MLLHALTIADGVLDATGSLQPPSGLSIFGQTSSAQTSQTPGTTTVPPPSQPAYFSSLLEKGKKRPLSSFQNVSSVELPRLQLGLDDIRKSARGLGASGPRNAANKPVVTEHRMYVRNNLSFSVPARTRPRQSSSVS